MTANFIFLLQAPRQVFFFALLAGLLVFTPLSVRSRTRFIPLSEIHPGMVGYGKTVFEGTRIETFRVIVLGILPKALADADLILVRVESPYLKRKKIGLVAGMSGSPIYFNGKLAGAIAYGWPFTREALAGITPIEAMLRSGGKGSAREAAIGAPAGVQVKNLPASVQKMLPPETATLSSLTLEPLRIPVSVSGFDATGMDRLQSEFPMFHVVAGGGEAKHMPLGPAAPGQSVEAALMKGDFSVMATGTLTYREGSKILAFGHPFLFLGDVDFPLYESYVHYVLPSIQLPFKFASPIKAIGRISEDRLYSIGGNLGEKARMVPLSITVTDVDRHLKRSFHVQIFRNPDFTPRLTGAALEQAISSTSKLLGDATARLDYELEFKEHPTLHLKNLVLSEQSISSVIGAEILKPMLQVLENDFERVDLAGIRVRVSIQPNLAAATLQKVVLNKHRLLPGEPLWVTVILKPYNKKMVQKKFQVTIPSDVLGNVQVGVAGGSSADQLRKTMQQPLADPLNVDQIIGQIQETPPDNSLIIRLTLPRKGIHWAGEDFGNMPQPYADLLKAAGSDPLDFHADGTATRYEMPWVVVGTDVEDITVGTSKEAPPSQKKPPRIPPHSLELPSIPPILEEPGSSKGSPHPGTPYRIRVPLLPPSQTYPLAPDSSSSSSLDFDDHNESEDRKTTFEAISNLKDWQEGTLRNMAISPDGDLLLGPEVETLAKFNENVLFSQVKSGEDIFVGTANPGKIYKISREGRKTLFFDPQSVAVMSLAPLPNGELLAGVIGGELYWLSSAGKVRYKWRLREDYIWQILIRGKSAYIATGSPRGDIYTLNTAEENPAPEPYYSSSQSHILSLYAFPDGKLYAGTANDGLLLEIDPNGTSRTVYDFDEPAVLALGASSDGKLIIGTSGKGSVYLLNSANLIQKIAGFPDEDVTWVGARGDEILAATGIPARLYAVKPGDGPALLWDGKINEQVALRGAPDQSDTFYVSGNDAALLHISSESAKRGDFTSMVIDTGGRAVWGRLDWHGHVPRDCEISVRSRAGNSAVPDPTWSAWSQPYSKEGQDILNAPSRFIQLKVDLSSMKKGITPDLEAIHYFWRQENLPPSIEVSSPAPGDTIGPKTTLHAKIRDKDGDTVKVEFWTEDYKGERINSEKVFTQLYPISKSKGEDEISVPLDMIHKDGHLHLRVTISDSPGNKPEKAFSAETVLKDLTYDSSLPSLDITNVKKDESDTTVEGVASDKTSYVKTVQFRLDDGPWLDTIPERGIFDSPEAKFTFELDHNLIAEKVEIRALDGADNEKSIKKSFEELTGVKPSPEKLKSKKASEKALKSKEEEKSKTQTESTGQKEETKEKSKDETHDQKE